LTRSRRVPVAARRIDVDRPDGTPLPASPHRVTFSDALTAAAFLVRGEHAPSQPCDHCKATLALLKQTNKALDDIALGNALVWPAVKASARRAGASRRTRGRV
jgi:hypothetical protein